MKNIISFSGGRTSAYLVHKIKQSIDTEAKIIFLDTGAEHPKTYKFIRDISFAWKLNIICLRLKINPVLGKGNSYTEIKLADCKQDLVPWVEMMKKYGTPYNPSGGFCTRAMKTRVYESYCNEHFGRNKYITWLGMRIDEPNRMVEQKGRIIKYLGQISNKEKIDILNWWSEQSFDLEIPEHLGNCVFCIKKGNNKVALAIKDEPKMYQRFKDIIYSESVRVVEARKAPSNIMYRGHNSIDSIKNIYNDISRDEIMSTLRNSKRFKSGSCSESCELFSE
jgi:hypothetical protein